MRKTTTTQAALPLAAVQRTASDAASTHAPPFTSDMRPFSSESMPAAYFASGATPRERSDMRGCTGSSLLLARSRRDARPRCFVGLAGTGATAFASDGTLSCASRAWFSAMRASRSCSYSVIPLAGSAGASAATGRASGVVVETRFKRLACVGDGERSNDTAGRGGSRPPLCVERGARTGGASSVEALARLRERPLMPPASGVTVRLVEAFLQPPVLRSLRTTSRS